MAPGQNEGELVAAWNAVAQEAAGKALGEQGMSKLGLIVDRRSNLFVLLSG